MAKKAIKTATVELPAPTVALAQKLLADCKSGKVRAFAVATVGDDPPYTGSSSAMVLNDVKDGWPPAWLTRKLLIAAVEELKHEFKHAVRGG